jgi:hypothetical protein
MERQGFNLAGVFQDITWSSAWTRTRAPTFSSWGMAGFLTEDDHTSGSISLSVKMTSRPLMSLSIATW